MSNIQLKNRVIQELESADDYLLEEILSLIQLETDKDKLIEIPGHYKASLDRSIAQMNSGNTILNAEVEKKIEKWLYK
ncbi:MAG: hypothetical protein EA362_13795 [Saprospirales bacterium]|nr:MAG: hypothetical protein EA362_13795 [Saprospirales bacterium]